MIRFSEYVSLGHPDKIADYISQYILDRLIEQDPLTRYALEVQIKDNHINLAGEITTKAQSLDYKKWSIEAINDIGYTQDYYDRWGEENTINPSKITVEAYISKQSLDISQGVNSDGWGDQGIMFGMATNAKDGFTLDYSIAKSICTDLFNSKIGGLDIKTQVVTNGHNVEKVIVAIPTKTNIDNKVKEVISKYTDCKNITINGTGKYIKHASLGDSGTTGRKLVVDFYGGGCNIGGGSPWTKDATKADLTLNIYAREQALLKQKELGLKYVRCGVECAIGQSEVTVAFWNESGELIAYERKDVRPSELIKKYNLDKPIFAELCRNGLFSKL